METALEIFHIEFWQISGNHILIVKKIRTWQKWYICRILKLNLEMMLVERFFEVDIFINSDKTPKGSTVKVYFCFFIRF